MFYVHARDHLVFGDVLGLFFHVYHLFQGNHLAADFLLKGPHQILGGMQRVKPLFRTPVGKRITVIVCDHEMIAPVILSDNGLPQGFAGPGSAHGQRDQS